DDELEDVRGSRFTKLDGHHLELCYLLRDAAYALQTQGRPPLEQAERCFQWVVRQVALREREKGEKDLLPPSFVLRIGQGSAHERALLFLAVLDQLGLDGCMIALRGDPARYWLPGVFVKEKDRSEIYLFDTRLGMPLPGPGGKGIATLSQVRDKKSDGDKASHALDQLNLDETCPYDLTPDRRAGT